MPENSLIEHNGNLYYLCKNNITMEMNHLPKYPVSTADFERIRTRDYIYVDKTAYIHTLVTRGVYYFLSRPRRFGKSLLISTLEAYFHGKRNLFKGLAIERLQPDEWNAYPVLRFDMSRGMFIDRTGINTVLDGFLKEYEKEYGIEKEDEAPSARLAHIIKSINSRTKKRVVVLIDEYDSPLSGVVDNPELFEYNRGVLHGFYSVLKAMDPYIHFCMLTGVTKFGKMSVFSGLNNLEDISMDNRYAGICGITNKELHDYFEKSISYLGISCDWDIKQTYENLKFNYDGYHFSDSMEDVYNPYSVLNCLESRKIGPYWSMSGMPTLLVRLLKENDFDINELNGAEVTADQLSALIYENIDPIALFYQTGYLSIKGYDREFDLYTVGYPNREVEKSLLSGILTGYCPSINRVEGIVSKMTQYLRKGLPGEFVKELKSFLAGIPLQLRKKVGVYENYYHTIFYCVTRLLGLNVKAEYSTSEGFIDILIETKKYIYIVELKVNGNAAAALRQIEEKHYSASFESDSRMVYKIGIGFSKQSGTIDSVEIAG